MFFTLLMIVVALVAYLVYSYNSLQRMAQSVRESHSNIMASMKKRFDLANRLMEIASGYGEHEKLTFISVANSVDVGNIAGIASDINQSNQAINRVTAIATQFPELKANATYQQLMEQLNSLESELQRKRETYNSQVRNYNNCRSTIPQLFFASKMGFSEASYFDVENSDSLENLSNFKVDDGKLLQDALGSMADKMKNKFNK